jgi:hypothetical protein
MLYWYAHYQQCVLVEAEERYYGEKLFEVKNDSLTVVLNAIYRKLKGEGLIA